MISCRPGCSIFRSAVQVSRFSTLSRKETHHFLPLVTKMRLIYNLVPFPVHETDAAPQSDQIFRCVMAMAIAAPELNTKLVQEHPLTQQIKKEMEASLGKTMAAASREWGFSYWKDANRKHPDCFLPVKKPELSYAYALKEGVMPSEGLERFVKGPTTTDCGGVAEAIFFKIIADIIGKERIDALFSHPKLPLGFQSGGAWAPGSLLHLFTEPAHIDFNSSDRSHITLGTRAYFQGVPWYGIKHPTGIGHGFHVIHTGCTPSGQKLYWGFGFKTPLTEEGIHSLLLGEYNKPRSEEDAHFVRSFTPENFKKFMLETHTSKMEGFEAEIDRAYENPHEACSMEKALDAGLGFYGYITVNKLSLATLGLIKRAPVEHLKSPGFLTTLSLMQALRMGHLAIELHGAQQDAVSATSKEARHFKRWCGRFAHTN